MENYGDAVIGGFALMSVIFLAIVWIVMFILTIVILVAGAKMIQKAGRPGWSIIVPVYNIWVISEIAIGKGWLGLLCFVPFVNFIAMIYLFYKLAQSFGASDGLCVINAIFPVIGYFAFGFGPAEYVGPASSII